MACLTRRYLAHFERGRFDEVCQACYVIVCCGERPARLAAMTAELEVLRPLRAVDVCLFAGHRSCPLSEHSAHDLNNNFMYVFRDALRRGAERALVLEDDFHIESIEDDDVSSVVEFLRGNKPCVYGLGNVMQPTPGTLFLRHQKSGGGFTASHACFYSSAYMQKIVNFFAEVFADRIPADFYCNDRWPEFFHAEIYRYYKPLLTQLLPATENQTEGWARCKPGNRLGKFHHEWFRTFLRWLNLHRETQPGWKILYFVYGYGPFIFLAAILLVAVRALWQ
jgi:hypothetical protein